MGTIVGGVWAVVHCVFADLGFPISCWITFETSCLLIPAFYFYIHRKRSQRLQVSSKAPTTQVSSKAPTSLTSDAEFNPCVIMTS